MLVLSSISSGFGFWSVNHTLIYENFELIVSKNIEFFGKISKVTNWFIRDKCLQDSWIMLIVFANNITTD